MISLERFRDDQANDSAVINGQYLGAHRAFPATGPFRLMAGRFAIRPDQPNRPVAIASARNAIGNPAKKFSARVVIGLRHNSNIIEVAFPKRIFEGN
jgi:hypothetical protein